MLFNSYDTSHLYHDHETCKQHSFNSNSYSAQLRPLESLPSAQLSALQIRGSKVGIHPGESYGLLQSQDGGRHFQNMLYDACNRDDYWRSPVHQRTTPEGYLKVEPTYNAISSHPHHPHHHPSLATSQLLWSSNLTGYENYTGEMVDYHQCSTNVYQAVQPPQSHDRSEVGEEMTLFINRSISGQVGIVAKDCQAPLPLPLFDHRHYHTLSGRDHLECSEANPSSFLKCSSSSRRLMQHPSISDNSVPTTSGSNHSSQTQIKAECASVSSSFWKTEESKMAKQNLESSTEDVHKNSIPFPSVDAHQRKSGKSTGKTRTKETYRTAYSESQRLELEQLYSSAAYIATSDRKNAIARSVGLTDRQVKIWFQNRRAKERKDRRKTTESRQYNQHQQQHHQQQQRLPSQ